MPFRRKKESLNSEKRTELTQNDDDYLNVCGSSENLMSLFARKPKARYDVEVEVTSLSAVPYM